MLLKLLLNLFCGLYNSETSTAWMTQMNALSNAMHNLA